MEGPLITFLKAHAAVAAQVGTRVYPALRPQDSALPCLVVTLIASPGSYVFGARASLSRSLIQVDVYGETWTSANNAGAAVLAALDGLAGTMMGTVRVAACQRANVRSTAERGPHQVDPIHRRMIEFRLWHS